MNKNYFKRVSALIILMSFLMLGYAQNLTPRIGQRLSNLCMLNLTNRAYCISWIPVEERAFLSPSELLGIIQNLDRNLDKAGDIVVGLHRWFGDEFSMRMRAEGFTLGEIEIMENYVRRRHSEQANREREQRYQRALDSADRNFQQGRYAEARQNFQTALEIHPTRNANLINSRIREIDRRIREAEELENRFQSLVQSANSNFEQRRYEDARRDFRSALALKPDRAHIINPEITRIDNLLQFLAERENRVFDYATYFASDYNTANSRIKQEIKSILLGERNVNPATISITITNDIAGVSSTGFSSTVDNPNLERKFRQIAENIRLRTPIMYGYTVASRAVFDYTISANESIIRVNNNASGLSSNDAEFRAFRNEIARSLDSAPMGRFRVQVNNISINETEYTQTNVLAHSDVRGPSNALLSVVVPGWGSHRVSYGATNMLWRTIPAYGLVGAGIAGLNMSDNENFISENAELLILAGAVVWAYDVFWTWRRGTRNVENARAYRQSHLGFFYEPNLQATGLTFAIVF